MKYPNVVKTLSERITRMYPNALVQLMTADPDGFKAGRYAAIQFPAYLLWMLREMETFDDPEKSGGCRGWVMAHAEILGLVTLQESRDLTRADKQWQRDNHEAGPPKFLMEIGGEKRYLVAKQAGIAYNSGLCLVNIGGDVLECDGRVRPITPEERRLIAEIAEEYCADK